MKALKTISLLTIGVAALTLTAADFLYFHYDGEVIKKLPAENAERIVMTTDKNLKVVDANDNALYTVLAEDVDSITFLAPMPQADLLNVVFKEDGTAEDVSPMKFPVERGGTATTEWDAAFNCYAAKIEGNTWASSNVANQFYRIDYTNNTAFKNALADGHTLEVLFKPSYTGTIKNGEAKIFSSHEAGGTGIMIKSIADGSAYGAEALNSLTFLPNVSKTTTSTWQAWASSGFVPESDVYYHIIGVWDKNAKKAMIYVNGELMKEVSIDGSNYVPAKTGATKFCIGGDPCPVTSTKPTGVQNGVNGTIVLARIYDDPLNAEQAERLYQAVEKGIVKTQPMVENVSLLENVQVKGGASYPVYGTGFEDGDVIKIDSDANGWELPATANGTEGVKVTLPSNVKGGEYIVSLKRGDRTQKLGTVNFTLVNNFDVKSQIVSHRGYWAKPGASENSRAALQNAIDLKTYGAETDIWLTKDNVLVINHNSTIGGVSIQNSNYEDLKDIKLSNGETLPTFADFLEILKGSDHCKLIIETKTHSTEARTIEAAKAAAEAVKAAGLEDKVVYIAFNYATCKALAIAYPNADVQFLCDKTAEVRTPAQLYQDGKISVAYKTTILNANPTFIEDAHKLGLKVNTWTISTSAEIGNWINKGADIITSDTPVIGMKYLDYYNSNK